MSPFIKIVIQTGVATCCIIKTSTADLYIFSTAQTVTGVTQTAVVCLKKLIS